MLRLKQRTIRQNVAHTNETEHVYNNCETIPFSNSFIASFRLHFLSFIVFSWTNFVHEREIFVLFSTLHKIYPSEFVLEDSKNKETENGKNWSAAKTERNVSKMGEPQPVIYLYFVCSFVPWSVLSSVLKCVLFSIKCHMKYFFSPNADKLWSSALNIYEQRRNKINCICAEIVSKHC